MMALTISPKHLLRPIPLEAARELFKSSVSLVEMEVFTYCNRKCWFCANSYLDRRGANNYMDENLYLGILRELSDIDYRGIISYCRYNEPLADRIILTRLRQAREMVPNAILSTHTNGDYLDRDYLEELKKAGLNRLHVQVYLGNDEKFSDNAILTRMSRRLNDLGLPYEFIMVIPFVRYMAKVSILDMEVTFDARNFAIIGVDRGQTVALPRAYQRTSPCLIVFQHLYIDHDGSVVPCCNIRSDEPSHKPYVVDKLLAGKSIFDVYANSQLTEWRRELLTYGNKRKPCDTCSYEVPPDTAELRAKIREIG